MSRSVGVAVFVLVSTLAGCVKKSDYEALQRRSQGEKGALEQQLAQEKARGVSLEEALKQEQDKNKQQADEIARLQEELKAAQDKIVAQQQQLTDNVKS